MSQAPGAVRGIHGKLKGRRHGEARHVSTALPPREASLKPLRLLPWLQLGAGRPAQPCVPGTLLLPLLPKSGNGFQLLMVSSFASLSPG